MKRKVVKHGSSTLTISLPSKWAKRFNIRQGDELHVEEKERSLVISTDKNYAWEKATIDLNKIGFFNKNLISNVYHVGYDEVELFYDGIDVLRQVIQRLSDCIGYEIVNQSEKRCVIRSISTISDTEFDKVLSRTFLVTLSMAKDMHEAIKSREFHRLKDLRVLESTNNKFTDYCRRILNKKGYKTAKMTPTMYSLVHDMEKIGDDYKHICDLLEGQKGPISKETLRIFEEVNDYFETFYRLFYKFDKERAEKMFSKGKMIIKNAFALYSKKPVIEIKLLTYLINLTTKIYELTLPYFEMNL